MAADALSCFPVDQPSLEDELCEAHAEAAVEAKFADKSTHDIQLNEVCEHQKKDTQLRQVIE